MFLMLLVFWLIFNGRVTTEIVLVGIVVCAAVTLLWRKIFHIKHSKLLPSLRIVWHYLRYIGNLIVEIIRCNIQVMRLILHPKEEVHPQLVTFPVKLEKENHKVILANSITLTPGTITVGLRDHAICVHGLDASFTEGIENCDMADRLMKMEEVSKDV